MLPKKELFRFLTPLKELKLIWKILCVFALQILFLTYMIVEKQLPLIWKILL